MTADVLAPCITRSSVIMVHVLTMQDQQGWEIIENALFSVFWNELSMTKVKNSWRHDYNSV